ncbi:MAG: hypothetical protein INR70_02070 [Parafilimonas terrae]|jgi:hypothetical protein|nr:hypothetical protein [Parafilimonas terrae]
MADIRRGYAANFGAYGVWKVWRPFAHQGIAIVCHRLGDVHETDAE